MIQNTYRFIMSTSSKGLFIPLCILILLSSFIISTFAIDTIILNQTIKDGDTIVSSDGSFAMGFFSPGISKNRYVGIYYNNIKLITPVWVANRENPLTDSLGTLKLIEPGVLVLLNSTGQTLWSSNVSNSLQNPVAQLLDLGNLVIKNSGEENPKNFLWQSFDYPGNTLMAGMKIGKNFVTGQEWYLSSWKSEDDPSPGDYKYRIDTQGYLQIIMWKGKIETFRIGPWIGDRFSGAPILKPNIIYKYDFMFSKEEVHYSNVILNNTALPRRVLNPLGQMQWWTWVERRTVWNAYSNGPPTDPCDNYGLCGAYGTCNIDNSPICGCLDKFVSKNPSAYNSGDWGTGCVRRTNLDCKKGDKFLKYSQLKLPETRNAWFNTSMTLEECRVTCLGNCSCMAYSNLNFSGKGNGCLMWFQDLMDLRQVGVDGQDVYLRMAASEAVSSGRNKSVKTIIGLAITIPVLLFLSLTLFVWKKKQQKLPKIGVSEHSQTNEASKEDLELPLFELAKIIDATDNFSLSNKLGEGGYGTVYKAILEGGQEVAVKRLSRDSKQGFVEFMNEVTFIAKLQHRNLVKLLGCCIQAEEKMLIYEYMPNKSLDVFIFGPFDEARSSMLDWPMRFHIIKGISRGLVYLHQDSRLRIIHRDLKASNILLDADMNPKIADFGMARCFGGNEATGSTKRVVGT